jgi:tRNA threonylcarbamoyladenosine biosynthesis protein TsaE
MKQSPLEIVSESTAETTAVGAAIAGVVRAGDVVLLHGDLGAGKTTLAKGIAAGLGVDAIVSSPSFALINEYVIDRGPAGSRLYHVDLYRLQGEEDLASIGFAELVAPSDGVTVVEWPERAVGLLPERYLLVEFEHSGADLRRLAVSAFPPAGALADRVADLRARLGADSG